MSPDLLQKSKQLTRSARERMSLLRALTLPEQSVVLLALTPHVQQSILTQLKNHELVDILDHMDVRSAESLLSRISSIKRRDRIVAALKGAVKDKIEYFLRFHPKATVALINFNYLLLPASLTIGATADAIDEHYNDTGKFPEVLVHEAGVLVGEVPMSNLVRERNTTLLRKQVVPVATVPYQAEVADIVNALAGSQKRKVVVLDVDDSVLGIIYADEALSLFGDRLDESLYDVAGVADNERPFDGALTKFKNRYRWLMLNLLTCFFAGGVIYLFEDTIDTLVILAMYIPIVAGMGGNAAAQTFAVTLRGITLGSISLKNCWPAIWREVGAGMLNGVVIGIIVAAISVIWNESWLLGLAVGLTMVGAHMIAGFFGGVVPLIMKRLGYDPAATSSIFITTATDVGGLVLLLGLGTLLLM
ncbi:magnesium transporter [Patescibacteria group bacterium]|nr:magnesium transporter [Patescibacteria group bacterium]